MKNWQDLVSSITEGELKDYVKSIYAYDSGNGLLIILRSVNDVVLQTLHAQRKLSRFKGDLKLFSYAELKSSLDVFPLEFHADITMYEHLYGEETLASLSPNQSYLRHELEFYFRSYLMTLREGYIQCRSSCHELVAQVKPSLIRLFRGFLIMRGESGDMTDIELIDSVFSLIQQSSSAFLSIWQSKRVSESEFVTFLAELSNVVSFLNEAH